MPPDGWSRGQRRLHGAIALLVLAALAIAPVMVGLGYDRLLLKFLLYQAHKSIGLLVLLLAVTQLALHARRGRPASEDDLPPWQRRAARAMHAALFALLLAMPALGYLTAASAPIAIPTFFLGVIPVPHLLDPDAARFAWLRGLHEWAGWLLALLVAGHAGMAIRHHWQGRPTLRRMWRGG
ncbi:cytochrome b [Roseomonas sp. 18066]|uniref:cytochrome b n=1 Tax=Roseomonas sp. 18066 TaxID=2681412 RepID=UPI00135B326C|nr:cytochrome b/b6 domain-containing protein [Roseomonas sp. 18066]